MERVAAGRERGLCKGFIEMRVKNRSENPVNIFILFIQKNLATTICGVNLCVDSLLVGHGRPRIEGTGNCFGIVLHRKGFLMIDASDHVPSAAQSSRRRSKPAATARNHPTESPLTAPSSVPIERVFSDPTSNPSTKSNGKSARLKSPTTPARSFSSRKTSKCPNRGRFWPPRWSFPSIFTANRTPANAKHRSAS